MKSTVINLALIAALATSTPVIADVFDRGAKGDITQFAGARRIGDRIAQEYKAELDLAQQPRAKNVILLIGDGMGDSEITAARNFAVGAGGYFKGLDALPFTGQYTHYSLDKETGKPNYVTDSAASATAWSTGIKSYNRGLGVGIDGKSYASLLRLAKNAGLGTGNVSTAEIQDATPAAQYAHVEHRKCYTPKTTLELCPKQAKENGGLGSITEQLLDSRYDVVLGGGAKYFNEEITAGPNQGKTLIGQARSDNYQIVTNERELRQVEKADTRTPVLGLFSEGNMPIRLQGPQATQGGNLNGTVVQCNPVDRGFTPTLAQMTSKAIELLHANDKGFFLQVEGASIDKQAHLNNPCGQFGETVDLDEAVQVAMEYARKYGNTLVIVTADHGHATQIIPTDVAAPGYTQLVQTFDGVPMGVSYGNSNDQYDSVHTGTQLKVAAYGPGAINITGLTDQTDLFFIIKNALDL